MSETKPSERTLQQVQEQYQQLCFRAGALNYQIFVYQKDLEMVNNELRDLNIEAAAIKGKEEAAKAAVDSKAEVTS